MAEAQAAVAAAEGEHDVARARLQSAAEQFGRAGQPLDARLCRQRSLRSDPAAARRRCPRLPAGRAGGAGRSGILLRPAPPARGLPHEPGGANSSRAMLSGSRNESPEP